MNELQSLANQAYAAIRKDLLTCALDPGSRIAQAQLVERYKFGITPVREALKRLEQEGYVQSIPRFGYLITPITLQDVEDLYDLRMILETSSVRRAIERTTDRQIAELCEHANFTYTFKDPESYLEFLDHNIEFHVSIALASGNRKLAEIIAGVLSAMTRIFNLGLDLRDSAEEMRQEHLNLTGAIARRDLDAARQIVEDQISSSRRRVVEMMLRRQAQSDLQILSHS